MKICTNNHIVIASVANHFGADSFAYIHTRIDTHHVRRKKVMFVRMDGCVRRNMGYNFGVDLPVNYAVTSVDDLIGSNRRNLRLHTT